MKTSWSEKVVAFLGTKILVFHKRDHLIYVSFDRYITNITMFIMRFNQQTANPVRFVRHFGISMRMKITPGQGEDRD